MVGQIGYRFARPNLARIRPNLARHRPNSTTIGPGSAKIDPESSTIGPNSVTGQHRHLDHPRKAERKISWNAYCAMQRILFAFVVGEVHRPPMCRSHTAQVSLADLIVLGGAQAGSCLARLGVVQRLLQPQGSHTLRFRAICAEPRLCATGAT